MMKSCKIVAVHENPFAVLLFQEGAYHFKRGFDVPRLVDEVNTTESCRETILEEGQKKRENKRHRNVMT